MYLSVLKLWNFRKYCEDLKIGGLFQCGQKKEMLALWVADKILDAVEDDDQVKDDAIKIVQERME